VGEKLLSQDESGNKTISTVQELHQPISDNMCEIGYTNGESLKVTKGHPLFTNVGWKAIDPIEAAKEDPGVPVTKLLVGDLMAKDNGTWPQVSKISCWKEKVQTYNFTVDNSSTYFAGGFLAHNKGGCFPPGTKVKMGDGTQKNIEEVEVGDEVLSESEDRLKSVSKVQSLQQQVSDNLCTIYYSSGDDLKLTSNHPVYTTSGWKAIDPIAAMEETPDLKVTSLVVGDKQIMADGSEALVKNISCRSQSVETYNLKLDGNVNTYFADDFLVHNKGTCQGCGEEGAVRSVYPVSSVNISKINATAARVEWGGNLGGCGARRNVAVIIGTDIRKVAANCWDCGADYPGNPGYHESACGANHNADTLPPGCTATRVVGTDSPGSWDSNNPSNGVALELGKTYYIKVISMVSHFIDDETGDRLDVCGGTTSAFLGYCPVTPSSAEMDVNPPNNIQTFTTTIDQEKNTTYVPTPVVTYKSATSHKEPNFFEGCERMCGGQHDVADGVRYYGYDWGSGDVNITACVSGSCGTWRKTVEKINDADSIRLSAGELASKGLNTGALHCLMLYSCTDAWTATISYINGVTTLPSRMFNIPYTRFGAPPTYLTLNPVFDSIWDFLTEATAINTTDNQLIVSSDVFSIIGSTVPMCSDEAIVTLNNAPPEAWWQVQDSDVATNGNLTSAVPGNPDYFGLIGSGGFPGLPAFGSTNIDKSDISETNWLAQSTISNPRLYDFQYFITKIPEATVINEISSFDQGVINGGNIDEATGYYWYRYDGSATGVDTLSLDSGIANMAGKKVILLVKDASFNIGGTINLVDGQEFFMAIVDRNVTVNPAVGGATAALEGLYLADEAFSDGTTGDQTDVRLHVRGSVVAFGSVNLQRDLGTNNSSSAELFEYAPDQIMLFPKVFGVRKINWKEVAP
jgi:hypothetical protein